MTRCKYRVRPVWHETAAVERGRAVCVAESPSGLLMRLKNTRTIVKLPWSQAWLWAARLAADEHALAKRRPADRPRRTARRSVARGRL